MPQLSPNRQLQLRLARRADTPLLFSLIRELAEYEEAPEKVTGSEEMRFSRH